MRWRTEIQADSAGTLECRVYLNRNGQPVTLTKELLTKGVKTPQALKPLADEAKRAGKPLSFAMTFPPGPMPCGPDIGSGQAGLTRTKTSP
jgi:NMT1-like family